MGERGEGYLELLLPWSFGRCAHQSFMSYLACPDQAGDAAQRGSAGAKVTVT